MDPIMAEKLQAMKKYKKDQYFVNSIINLHSLVTALMLCTLFCAYPFWYFSPSFNHFASVISIPNFKSLFFNPKCLFVVGNAIVAILFMESKLAGSSSSPASDIYDEYVERSQGRASPREEKKEERKVEVMNSSDQEETVKNMTSVEEIEYCDCIAERDKGEELEQVEVVNNGETKEKEAEAEAEAEAEVEEEEEEEEGLAAEELNKRVEDFIARVNRRRWLEEKLLLSTA